MSAPLGPRKRWTGDALYKILPAVIRPGGPAAGPRARERMDQLWTLLKTRALYVSFGHDAFNFDLSWLGIILVVAAALVIRRLRR